MVVDSLEPNRLIAWCLVNAWWFMAHGLNELIINNKSIGYELWIDRLIIGQWAGTKVRLPRKGSAHDQNLSTLRAAVCYKNLSHVLNNKFKSKLNLYWRYPKK